MISLEYLPINLDANFISIFETVSTPSCTHSIYRTHPRCTDACMCVSVYIHMQRRGRIDMNKKFAFELPVTGGIFFSPSLPSKLCNRMFYFRNAALSTNSPATIVIFICTFCSNAATAIVVVVVRICIIPR